MFLLFLPRDALHKRALCYRKMSVRPSARKHFTSWASPDIFLATGRAYHPFGRNVCSLICGCWMRGCIGILRRTCIPALILVTLKIASFGFSFFCDLSVRCALEITFTAACIAFAWISVEQHDTEYTDHSHCVQMAQHRHTGTVKIHDWKTRGRDVGDQGAWTTQ